MNYKGLPYRTEWVEYPDIADVSKKYGVAPTGIRGDGSPRYTLPMIYDPNTESAIAESAEIGKYLDATYPSTPKLFQDHTHALQCGFVDSILGPQVVMPLAMNVNPEAISLSPRSLDYIQKGIIATFGKTYPDVGNEGHWKLAEETLGKIKGWMTMNGPGKENLITGDVIGFADFQLAATFIWAKAVYGEDSAQWARICRWHDGMWVRYLAQFEKYMAVDNI